MINKIKDRFTACAFGIGVMILISAMTVLVGPIFIINEYLPMEYTGGAIIISMAISALLGGVTAGIVADNRAGETVLITIGAYSALLLFIAIFFFNGFTSQLLYELLASIVGGVAAWLLLVKRRKPRNKRKKRMANR